MVKDKKKTLTISSNLKKKIDTSNIQSSSKKTFSVEKKKPFRQNKNFNKRKIQDINSREGRFYIRMGVDDKPGVLAKISGTFGENNVSIESVIQEGRGDKAELVLVTHEAPEKDIKNSIDQISALDSVTTVTSTLRVYV